MEYKRDDVVEILPNIKIDAYEFDIDIFRARILREEEETVGESNPGYHVQIIAGSMIAITSKHVVDDEFLLYTNEIKLANNFKIWF